MLTAGVGLLCACADGVGPDTSPDVLTQTQSAGTASDTTKPGTPSQTPTQPTTPTPPTPPGQPSTQPLNGTVVDVPFDSTETWHTVSGVRLELGKRDDRTGAPAVIASTTSDAEGRFTFDNLKDPVGLLYVRAVPAAGRYRTTHWIAAYTLASTTAPIAPSGLLVLERSGTPQSPYAPMLVLGKMMANQIPVPGRINGYDPAPGVTVLLSLPTGVAGPDSVPPALSGPPVASARTDANGFFIVQVPGPGTLRVTATAPPDSPFESLTRSYGLAVRGREDASLLHAIQLRLLRRGEPEE